MDWSKTKTRLIIILLILNISLGAMYLINRSVRTPYSVSDSTLNELENRLKNYGIALNAPIPKSPTNIKPLIVKYEEKRPEDVNQKFFNGEGSIDLEEDISKITRGNEEINIINNRRLLYENYSVGESAKELDSEDLALKFLEDKGFSTEDLVLVNIIKDEDVTTYEYTRKYEEKLVESSHTRISISKGIVITMDRLWIEVIEKDMREIEIEPAHIALFTLLGREEFIGETIDSIILCYYFNPEEQGILEDNTRAERGRAIPGWRIGFESGSFVIVDNY